MKHNSMLDQIAKTFQKKTNQELLYIISTDSDYYSKEGIDIAIKELIKRGAYQENSQSMTKLCPHCLTEYRDGFLSCIKCNTQLIYSPLEKDGELSITRHINILAPMFPNLFVPTNEFYDIWDDSHVTLNLRLNIILDWLKCSGNSVMAAYSNNVNGGMYVMRQNKECLIFVNKKFRWNSFMAISVLAHEAVHHFMYNRAMCLKDTNLNELKTDILTLCTGLGILRINGMERSKGGICCDAKLRTAFIKEMLLSDVEILRGLGYFTGEQYCSYFERYLALRNISGSDVIGYIHPLARHFLNPAIASLKPAKELRIIRKLNQILKRNIILKRTIATVTCISVVAAILSRFYLRLIPHTVLILILLIFLIFCLMFCILWLSYRITPHGTNKLITRLFLVRGREK